MGRGNLKITCEWDRRPQVSVERDGLVVATADLDPGGERRSEGLVDATEIVPMTPEEWKAAKELAFAWIADNPKPAA